MKVKVTIHVQETGRYESIQVNINKKHISDISDEIMCEKAILKKVNKMKAFKGKVITISCINYGKH